MSRKLSGRKIASIFVFFSLIFVMALSTLNTQAEVASDASKDYGLITNGGIEEGIEPWEVNEKAKIKVTSDVAYAGSNSILVTDRQTTGSGPMQKLNKDVKLELGDVLVFSAKVMYDAPTAPDTKNFNITFRSGDWTTFEIMGTAEMTKGEWGTIEGEFVIGSEKGLMGNEAPAIFLETPWVSNPNTDVDFMDFYVDEVSVFIK